MLMRESMRSGVRAASWPFGGLVLTYLLCQMTPLGRHVSMLSRFGRIGTSESVLHLDLIVLAAISTGAVVLALILVVVIGGLRGRRRLALRNAGAVLGAIASAELLKLLLPSKNEWSRHWNPIGGGSFPSGHAVIVTSICLAVLSVSSPGWRRFLVGPLVACTAIAATATVTTGWHRPGDVVGSFFLAVAWQRAFGLRQPGLGHPGLGHPGLGQPGLHRAGSDRTRPSRPARRGSAWQARSPFALALPWWALVSALVLGSAAAGLIWGTMAPGPHAGLAYLGSLVVLLVGSLITVAGQPSGARPDGPPPGQIQPPLRSFAGSPRA